MWGLITSIVGWLLGLLKGSTRDDEVALGRAQQQVADGKGDLAVIARANKAAQSASEKKVAHDENDLDASL